MVKVSHFVRTKKRRDDGVGRTCSIGNRVCPKRVPGVRIPLSPISQHTNKQQVAMLNSTLLEIYPYKKLQVK